MSTAVVPSTDFAVGFREMFLQEYATKELPVTKSVIDAVPEARKEYRPDPKARSASQLAWHLASSEVWFLSGIADGKLGDPRPQEKRAPKPSAEIPNGIEKGRKKKGKV